MSRNKIKVFDWNKAATLIKERKPEVASAGLSQDWEWTGGIIWQEGKPDTRSYTYLSSNWAIPQLDLDGDVVECWIEKDNSRGWHSGTKWPQSALDIIGSIP